MERHDWSAEIIVRLPYEVNEQNLDLTGQSGYGESTPGGVRSGNEIRWTFTDLEPTYSDNIQVAVLDPALWQKVLKEKENVARDPSDGEAWGRLAKAYKEAAKLPKGFLRDDPGGRELFALSREAYEKCLALLPDDSLWHTGYADLLWAKYAYQIYWGGGADTENLLPTLLSELQTALELDPDNERAKELLEEISRAIPEAVAANDDGSFTLLGLTATPVPPTPYPAQPTLTFIPTVTSTPSTPHPTEAPKETPRRKPPTLMRKRLPPARLFRNRLGCKAKKIKRKSRQAGTSKIPTCRPATRTTHAGLVQRRSNGLMVGAQGLEPRTSCV